MAGFITGSLIRLIAPFIVRKAIPQISGLLVRSIVGMTTAAALHAVPDVIKLIGRGVEEKKERKEKKHGEKTRRKKEKKKQKKEEGKKEEEERKEEEPKVH